MTMFPFRRVEPNPGRMVVLHGRTVTDRVRMVFGAAAISAFHETEAKAVAQVIREACAGQDDWCRVRGSAEALWMRAGYDPNEGPAFGRKADFDVYRTFLRLTETRRADCDCYTASLIALLYHQGIPAGAKVIEQRAPDDGKYYFNHIYNVVRLLRGKVIPVELTPVPPDNHRAEVGWETPRRTYRNAEIHWFDPSVWKRWVAACDLKNGKLAPLPPL